MLSTIHVNILSCLNELSLEDQYDAESINASVSDNTCIELKLN